MACIREARQHGDLRLACLETNHLSAYAGRRKSREHLGQGVPASSVASITEKDEAAIALRVPSWVRVVANASYKLVSPLGFSTAIPTRHRRTSIVGGVTTVGAVGNADDSDVHILRGTAARKASATRTTVCMPAVPIEPLVSISRITTATFLGNRLGRRRHRNAGQSWLSPVAGSIWPLPTVEAVRIALYRS